MESPTVPRNAAGVPLTLYGRPSPTIANEIVVDTSTIPDGVGGHVYTPDEIAAMNATERQALMNRLYEKYDGVSVLNPGGTREWNPDFDMSSADDALRVSLHALGATKPVPAVPAPAVATPPTPTPVVISVPATATQPAATISTGVSTTPGAHAAIGAAIQDLAPHVAPAAHGAFYRLMAMLGHGGFALAQSPIAQEVMTIELQKLASKAA